MRSSELRQLQRFFDAVEGYVTALSHDVSSCCCSLNEAGRWQAPPRGCGTGVPCRSVLHVVVRVHLARIRMPVDHITDPELDQAVVDLRALCLQAPSLSLEEFAGGIQRALHADRVAGNA